MYRPSQYDNDNTSINISTFGGINRRESIGVGEFESAKNLSSDEYPVLQPRQKYDRCLFNKFCLQWRNNNMFYALYPAIPYEDYASGTVKQFDTESDLRNWAGASTTEGGLYRALVGSQAYEIEVTVDGNTHSYSLKAVSSYILTQGFISCTLPDMPYFKDPVCTNIGCQTVINDKINGMIVINYDEKADAGSQLTYYKVNEKFEVENSISESVINNETGDGLIDGGDICHIRFEYSDGSSVKGFAYAVGNEGLNTTNLLSSTDYLVAYGDTTAEIGSAWFRVRNKTTERVDKIFYKYWMSGTPKYKENDYLYFGNHKVYYRNAANAANFTNSFLVMDGWREIKKIELNKDANDNIVAHALVFEAYPLEYKTMNDIATMWIYKRATNDIYYSGGSSPVFGMYLDDGFYIERKAPEKVDFMCTSANRVWCNNGQNEIMCCAQGNPNVWYKYEGNALDSYAVTIGGDGAFTGCIEYEYPLFFKNDKMYRITGTRPANYQTSEYSMRGVKNGCHNSLAVVNDVLFYQSMDGIYQYAGSTPACVSQKIFRNGWKAGYACRYRDKYYISVLETDDTRHLYSYDTLTGIWHEEEFECGEVVALLEGNIRHSEEEAMTIVTRYDDPEKDIGGEIEIEDNSNWILEDVEPTTDETELSRRRFKYYAGYVVTSDNEEKYCEEQPFEWEAVTGDLMAQYNEYKYIKRIFVNAKLDKGSSLAVYIECDQNGLWTKIASVTADKLKTYRLFADAFPRCESFKIKLLGKGKAVIRSVDVELEIGSDYR